MSPGRRLAAVVATCAVCGVALVVAHVFLGRSDLPAADVLAVLLGRDRDSGTAIIVLDYRLPRVLVGLGAGALLAASGVLVQSVVRNPLAEPATTGVGAGAALAVVVSLVVWPGHDLAYPAALLGAVLTGLLLLLLARDGFAIVGILLGAVLAASTSLLLVVQDAPMGTVLRWLVGSLNARTPEDWTRLWPWMLLLLPIAWLLTPQMNVWALGEVAAVGLGARRIVTIGVVLLVAITAAGVAIAATGAVAFVGLVAPHVARLIVGADHRVLVPAATALGAVLLSASDLVAFSISAQVPGLATDVAGVPVGAVTALLGAPVLVSLVRKESTR